MFETRTMFFSFACLKDAAGAGAVLKSAAPAPGSDQKKIGSGSRLRNTALNCVGFISAFCGASLFN